MTKDDALALSAGLLASYELAWARIKAQQAAIFASQRPGAQLRAFRLQVAEEMDALDKEAHDWVTNDFSGIYALGGAVGAGTFVWDQGHEDTATALGTDLYDRLTYATTGVERSARNLSGVVSEAKDVDGAGLEELLARRGITAVVYRNGARHGLGEYANMLIRTVTSLAYNAGVITAARASGVLYYRCSDGPNCGVDGHGLGETANGLVRDYDFATSHNLGHPNCTRQWDPLADVRTAEQARAAEEESPREPVFAEADRSVGTDRMAARVASRQSRLAARAAKVAS